MKELLVFGIGNCLMTDDGIGVHIVEELRRRSDARIPVKSIRSSTVRYIAGETDAGYCIRQIEESSCIIIIDAAYLGREPGAVSMIPYGSLNVKQPSHIHDCGVLLEIMFSGKDNDCMFIGIEPCTIDYGICLSPVLERQFTAIVDIVEDIVDMKYNQIH